MAKNLPQFDNYDITHKKMTPTTKNFFHCKTRKLAKPFEGLNSS